MRLTVAVLCSSIICLLQAAPAFCQHKKYDDAEMGSFLTLSRMIMEMAGRDHESGGPLPKTMTKKDIRAVAIKHKVDPGRLKILEAYELVIVSDGEDLGAVAWDPATGRKLFQDLLCTPRLDDPAWSNIVYGKNFTLDWGACQAQQPEPVLPAARARTPL